MPKLTVTASIKAKADKIDLVKAELLKLIDVTRAEKGCINYDLHQNNNDPAHFLFYENWESRKLWLEHSSNEHLKAYIAATQDALEEAVITEFTHIS